MKRMQKLTACLLSLSLASAAFPGHALAAPAAAARALRAAPQTAPLALPVFGTGGLSAANENAPLAPSLSGSRLPQLSTPRLPSAAALEATAAPAAANDNHRPAVAQKNPYAPVPVAASLLHLAPRRVAVGDARVLPIQSKTAALPSDAKRPRAVADTLRGLQGVARLPAALAGSGLSALFDASKRSGGVATPAAGSRGVLRRGELRPALPGGEGTQVEAPAPQPRFERPRGVQSNYFIWRALLYPFAYVFFGPRIRGLQNIPKQGPALLLPNHVTWIDVFLLSFAAGRPVRFLMYKDYYDSPVFHWFVKRFAPIPIEPGNPRQVDLALEEARDALSNGDLVAIFPEGTLTRNGTLRRFKRGLETISAEIDAPVIPVHLDGLWTSLLSRKPVNSGREFFQRIFTRSIIRFGTPLHKSTVDAARDAVEQLSALSMYERVSSKYAALGRQFLRSSYRYWFRPAFADSTGVSLSYGKALTGAWLIAGKLKPVLGSSQNVGILMPATVGGALANAALALMGKTSVNLNFTAPPDALRHAVNMAELRHIVTSRKFLDAFAEKKGWRLEDVLGPQVEFILLEDVGKTIPAWKKSLTYIGLLLGGPFIRLGSAITAFLEGSGLFARATIIFTSGSTAMPKGVPLSHMNILSNIEMIRDVYPLGKGDVVLGVLPFFHSFGYTVTLWMSVLMGVKTVYHPDPFDADAIGKLAQEHGATTILGTPTFLRRYRERIPKDYFDKMKLVVAGAEKLWSRDIESFESEYGTRPMEGYGATETAPVVSVSIPDWTMAKGARQKHRGYGYRENSVGVPLPGVAVRIIDPETGEFLPAGKQGIILVKGPNVMEGYLNDAIKTAEVLKDGWYYTGDIGYRDRDGFLFIVGRASRFAKLAGEMVPLGAVEEALHKALGLQDQTFAVFAVPDAKMGERLVVLHTGFSGSAEELLSQLKDLPRLWTPRAEMFFEIAEFPVLGTGKADLKALQDKALQLGGDSLN